MTWWIQMEGTYGTSCGRGIRDVWNPKDHVKEGKRVADERVGEVTCRYCKKAMRVGELEGKRVALNADGTKHDCDERKAHEKLKAARELQEKKRWEKIYYSLDKQHERRKRRNAQEEKA